MGGEEVHHELGDVFLLSIYDSFPAADWIEEHYDDVTLTNLRAKGYCGPMAILLSPQKPAIAMFGDLTKDIVAHLQALADVAHFPVLLLPLSHDPTSCVMYVLS